MIRHLALASAALIITSLAWAAFSPTGSVAKYRYTGYFEAMEVIYHSKLDEDVKLAVLDVLLTSPKMDQYLVEVSTNG